MDNTEDNTNINNDSEEEEEYEENEQIDLSQNELYQIGSIFFENEDGDSLSTVLTNLTKVQIALVDSNHELLKYQKLQTTSMQNIVKMLQKINKNLTKS